jgi:hypothetical protein
VLGAAEIGVRGSNWILLTVILDCQLIVIGHILKAISIIFTIFYIGLDGVVNC